MNVPPESKAGFCIYIDTINEGPRPVELDSRGYPIVYSSLTEAQRIIAIDTAERIRQFLAGDRDFEDAMTVTEHIVPVDVWSDGSISDEVGNIFGNIGT